MEIEMEMEMERGKNRGCWFLKLIKNFQDY